MSVLFLDPKERAGFAELRPGNHLEQAQGDFAHVVLFWLKNPDSVKDRQSFRTSLEKFVSQSPYIKTMHLGEPAATNRDVIDRSYTYMMILTFESLDAQNKYQEEQAHKIFIEESENLWSRVTVYDSQNLW